MHKFENLKYSHDNYYWLLKRYPKLLTRDKSKLGYTKFKVNRQGQYMNEHEIVEYILSLDEQLKKAYDIYQEYLVFNQIATIDMAEQWLNQLIDDYKASNITEYSSSESFLLKKTFNCPLSHLINIFLLNNTDNLSETFINTSFLSAITKKSPLAISI